MDYRYGYTPKIDGDQYEPGATIEIDGDTARFSVASNVRVEGIALNSGKWIQATQINGEACLDLAPGKYWDVLYKHAGGTAGGLTSFTLVKRPDTTIKTVEVAAYKAAHIRASGLVAACMCHWLIGDVRRGGFNAAHAAESGTVDIVGQHSKDAIRVTFIPQTFTTIQPGTDLATVLKDGARLRLPIGDYTLSRSVSVKDCIVVGDGPATMVKWTGKDRTLFYCRDSAFWNLSLDSGFAYDPGDFDNEKFARPYVFEPSDDCTFVGIRAFGFGRVFHCVGQPKRMLVQSCFADEKTRTYFAWYEGSDLVFYDNECRNSIFEHIARGGPSTPTDTYGWHYVAFDGNVFENKDNRPADPNDTAKGTIVSQAGEWLYRRNNRTIGPTGLGPLAVGDNGYANQFTDHATVDNDIVTRPLQLWPGLRDALIVGVPIEPMQPRNLVPPKMDPRRIENVRLVGVAAPEPKPWMVDVVELEYTAE